MAVVAVLVVVPLVVVGCCSGVGREGGRDGISHVVSINNHMFGSPINNSKYVFFYVQLQKDLYWCVCVPKHMDKLLQPPCSVYTESQCIQQLCM